MTQGTRAQGPASQVEYKLEELSTSQLISCIRYALGVSDAAPEIPDWTSLIQLAESQNLLPLVADGASRCGISPPAWAAKKLRSALFANAKQVLVMTEELTRVVEALESAAIPVIAIKGPVAAHTLYHDPALRVFSDLDLLVPHAYLVRARGILSKCGYRAPGQEVSSGHFTEISLAHLETGIHIDLHWDLTPKNWFVQMPSGYWERTRRVPVGSHAIPTLGEGDTFFCLCLHGAKHGWSGLNWIVDLCALLLKAPEIAARAPAKLPMIGFGLAAVSEIVPELGIPVSARMKLLLEKTIHDSLRATSGETVRDRLRFQWRLGGNRIQMLRYLGERAATRLLILRRTEWP